MTAKYKQHSKNWARSSPTQRLLVDQYKRCSMNWERPSKNTRLRLRQYKRYSRDWERSSATPRLLVPSYKRHSRGWERPSPTPRLLGPWYKRHSRKWEMLSPIPRLLGPRYKRHSSDWERSSPTPRLLGPWYKRHSRDWEMPLPTQRLLGPWYKRHSSDWKRPSPTQRQIFPPYKRCLLDWERPAPTQMQLVSHYKSHSMYWERPPPTQMWPVPWYSRYSMDLERPCATPSDLGQPSLYVHQYDRNSMNWETPSPTPTVFISQYNRHSMDSARPSSTQRQLVHLNNRHSKDSERPSPTPRLVSPQDNRNFVQKSSKRDVQSTGSIVYPDRAIFRWFATPLNGDNQFPSSVSLEPFSLEPLKKKGNLPLVLVNSHRTEDMNEEGGNISRRPWESIAENVWSDILFYLEIVRKKMNCQELEEVYPKLVVRFGKVIFDGNRSSCLDNLGKSQLSETTLGKLVCSFYTNVPSSYREKILREVVPNIGVDFEEEKDIYHVRLSDSRQSDSIISCKCSLREDKKLELYKVKLIHQLRHMVINISCLDKDVDLRLMLSGKRILTALTDDDMQRISNLINSAVLDPDVKGGLRWPQEAYHQSSIYNVVGVWHTISKVYKSPSLMLEVRHADRYDFQTATGSATTEATLKLKRIVSELLAQKLESNLIYDMFKDTLRMIWEHFLCCEQFLT